MINGISHQHVLSYNSKFRFPIPLICRMIGNVTQYIVCRLLNETISCFILKTIPMQGEKGHEGAQQLVPSMDGNV